MTTELVDSLSYKQFNLEAWEVEARSEWIPSALLVIFKGQHLRIYTFSRVYTSFILFGHLPMEGNYWFVASSPPSLFTLGDGQADQFFFYCVLCMWLLICFQIFI